MRIKGYLTFKDSIGDQSLVLDPREKITLRQLLEKISRDRPPGDPLFHFSGSSLQGRLIVLVNGRHLSQLPEGLDTILDNEDELAIFPPIAGG